MGETIMFRHPDAIDRESMSEPSITTVYTPDSSLANPRKMVAEMFRDLFRGREMAWRLAVRDIQAQYRQTYFGILWAFIGPLATTITWIFLSAASGMMAKLNFPREAILL